MCQYEALAIYSYLFVYQDRITGDIGTVPGFSNPQHPPVGAGCHSEGRIWGLIPDSHSRKFWWSSTNQISTILWTWSKYVDMFYEIVWDSEWNRLIDLFWCFAFWTRFRQCFRQCFLHFVFFFVALIVTVWLPVTSTCVNRWGHGLGPDRSVAATSASQWRRGCRLRTVGRDHAEAKGSEAKPRCANCCAKGTKWKQHQKQMETIYHKSFLKC